MYAVKEYRITLSQAIQEKIIKLFTKSTLTLLLVMGRGAEAGTRGPPVQFLGHSSNMLYHLFSKSPKHLQNAASLQAGAEVENQTFTTVTLSNP